MFIADVCIDSSPILEYIFFPNVDKVLFSSIS